MTNGKLTVEWGDYRETQAAFASRPGLEIMSAIRDGEYPHPPMLELMGIRCTEVEHGRIVFTCVPGEQHYNPMGIAHGGLVATMADTALGTCIQTTLPAGTGHTTLEIKVNYIRPITAATGPIRVVGTVIHVGRRTATSEAQVYDQYDKLMAHGTTTCFILQMG